MVRDREARDNEIRRLRNNVANLETELRLVSSRLARLEIEEAEEAVGVQEPEVQEPSAGYQIQIGNPVRSRNPPYHNSTVVDLSPDGYWVYIRNARGQRKQKAIHNVELA